MNILQFLGQRNEALASRIIDEETAQEAARMVALEKELETYVADMRANWRQSMIPRSQRLAHAGAATREIVAA